MTASAQDSTPRRELRVLIAAAGTGGHVYPGIALADALEARCPGSVVGFLGGRRGTEHQAVPAAGYHLDVLAVRPLRRPVRARALLTLVAMVRATWQTRALVRRTGADVVVGMGGAVTLPAALGARLAGIPVILHEQNAVAGLANRLAGFLAQRVGLAQPEAAPSFLVGRTVVVGNPVRAQLVGGDRAALRAEALRQFDLVPDRHTVLVFGGSQGARRLNTAVIEATTLWSKPQQLQILHLCGTLDEQQVRAAWDKADVQRTGLRVRVLAFQERMELAYAVADLALCRSGASTVAELTATATPAVLVPYPYATGDHQRANAQALAAAGGAVMILDAALDAAALVAAVEPLLADEDHRHAMRQALGEREHRSAARELVQVVAEVVAARTPLEVLCAPDPTSDVTGTGGAQAGPA